MASLALDEVRKEARFAIVGNGNNKHTLDW
jgi:hypothetical protein